MHVVASEYQESMKDETQVLLQPCDRQIHIVQVPAAQSQENSKYIAILS